MNRGCDDVLVYTLAVRNQNPVGILRQRTRLGQECGQQQGPEEARDHVSMAFRAGLGRHDSPAERFFWRINNKAVHNSELPNHHGCSLTDVPEARRLETLLLVPVPWIRIEFVDASLGRQFKPACPRCTHFERATFLRCLLDCHVTLLFRHPYLTKARTMRRDLSGHKSQSWLQSLSNSNHVTGQRTGLFGSPAAKNKSLLFLSHKVKISVAACQRSSA